jgi:hypothetical protein
MGDQLRLRMSLIDGPELRCPHCSEWWAITPEFWDTARSEFHMCIACKRDRARLYQRLRQRDKEYRDQKAEKSRRYRAWLAKTCPEYLKTYDRDRKSRQREYMRNRRLMLASHTAPEEK